MKERPILMNGEMVRAILDGRKTQTRRVIKCKPSIENHWVEKLDGEEIEMHDAKQDSYGLFEKYSVGDYGGAPYEVEISDIFQCPYGKPGDRLWVRETWWLNKQGCSPVDLFKNHTEKKYLPYQDIAAHWETERVKPEEEVRRYGWVKKPSIHMPRWASRITLEITNVRVERLNDISEEDAKAEGVATGQELRCVGGKGTIDDPWRSESIGQTFRGGFINAWCYVQKSEDAWIDNPWVWVIEFKRVKP